MFYLLYKYNFKVFWLKQSVWQFLKAVRVAHFIGFKINVKHSSWHIRDCSRIKWWLFFMWCLSLFGLCWARKTHIFILGTLTIMTVEIAKTWGSLKETLPEKFIFHWNLDIAICNLKTALCVLQIVFPYTGSS